MYLRKLSAVIASVLLFTCSASALGLSAASAVCIDMDSGRVLYAYNENTPMQIASTTKIMTALVVLENCSLEEQVKIPAQAVGIEGSSLYLKTGEILTVRDLLYGLMLRSGNDAAVALAVHCAGSVEKFADMMNSKAKQLGLENCSFVNPHGLSEEGHFCSAGDLAVISVEAMNNPDFAAIVSTVNYTFGNRTVVNHNKLLRLYDGAVGVKTGFTKSAGRTLVGAAEKDGQTLITVTLNAPDDWNDHIKLFDYGFDNYPETEVISKGQVMARLPVLSSNEDTVTVVANEDFNYPLSTDEKVEIKLHIPDFLFAPLHQGQYVGTAEILFNGQQIGEVLLSAGHNVAVKEPTKSPGIIDRILDFLT
ncbi:MAG: D-alanyl-D-alanine carboxypeptidase [Ruminococcaceae bacterium]|nr:D-alanyl-D-alanine carboxypeptidase [Oscillospiraceae bacterium]